MRLTDDATIKQTLERLASDMIHFMDHASYTRPDVDHCIRILEDYLANIEASDSKESGMQAVENAVVALNELNARLDYELIETEQREDIAEIIILAGHLKGYNGRDEDITEDWREW